MTDLYVFAIKYVQICSLEKLHVYMDRVSKYQPIDLQHSSASSFTPKYQMLYTQPKWFPSEITFEKYVNPVNNIPFFQYYLKSLIFALVSSLILPSTVWTMVSFIQQLPAEMGEVGRWSGGASSRSCYGIRASLGFNERAKVEHDYSGIAISSVLSTVDRERIDQRCYQKEDTWQM